jgi:hypothetical protein
MTPGRWALRVFPSYDVDTVPGDRPAGDVYTVPDPIQQRHGNRPTEQLDLS